MMLDIRDLSVVFTDRAEPFTAVDRFDLQMDEGEVVGIVGESGSGKSMTAHALMGLIQSPYAHVSGSAQFGGVDLLSLSAKELRRYQGKDLSIIFQEPMTSLNPTMRVGRQTEEALRIHTKLNGAERKARALEAMALAGLEPSEQLYRAWPHELSGGMRQRVMIAAALVLRPRLLIADEPTTALDVTIQAQILETLKEINRKEGVAILFISHDLAVVRALCRRVVVMKSGRIVETGGADEVFRHPREDYTKLLVSSRPARNRPVRKKLEGGDGHG